MYYAMQQLYCVYILLYSITVFHFSQAQIKPKPQVARPMQMSGSKKNRKVTLLFPVFLNSEDVNRRDAEPGLHPVLLSGSWGSAVCRWRPEVTAESPAASPRPLQCLQCEPNPLSPLFKWSF